MPKYLGVAKDEVDSLKVKGALTVGSLVNQGLQASASLSLSGPGSTVLTGIGRISQSLTPVSVATATCAEQTFTVAGLAVGDCITITPPTITAGVSPVCARVSAANTLAITFCNPTAGALVPAAGTYQIGFTR